MIATLLLLTALMTTTSPTSPPTTTSKTSTRERLFVQPLKADDVDDRVARSIERSVVEAAVAAGYDAISSTDVAMMLDAEAQKQLLGCDGESSCLAELLDGLGTRHLVAGSVVRLDDRHFELALTLLDKGGAVVVRRAAVDADSAAGLRDRARGAADQLFNPTTPSIRPVVIGAGVGGMVVGVVVAGIGLWPLGTALIAQGDLDTAATAYAARPSTASARDLAAANASYATAAGHWNTWGVAVAVVGGVAIVGGVVATVVGATALE